MILSSVFYLILWTDDNRAILPAHNSITFLSFGWHKALFARWPHWPFQTCYCLAHARPALHSLVGASFLGAVHISFYRFSTSTLQCYSQCVSRRLREKSVFFPECLTIRYSFIVGATRNTRRFVVPKTRLRGETQETRSRMQEPRQCRRVHPAAGNDSTLSSRIAVSRS